MATREMALRSGGRPGSDLLTVGFGMTVAMWAVGYVLRFPGLGAPGWLLLAALLGCLLAGGWLMGRLSRRGAIGGLQAGLLAGLLNLLVLGSVLGGGEGRIMAAAVAWIPGSLLLSGGLGYLGALLGAGRGRMDREGRPADPFLVRHGVSAFATVAAAATFLLLVAGGIVTGHEAGLAVPDWPNSYGFNMFLYPLSRMTGGIYYEHVHRLLGSLVGLTTLVLCVHLWRVEDRGWVKGLATGALLLVITQGILGGLRVTGRFTLADDPALTSPNLMLAVVHGVVGQVFFGTMVALAAITHRRWRGGDRPLAIPGARTDRHLAPLLVALVLVQLVLGSVLRHTDAALMVHIAWAMVVLGVGITLGVRLATFHRERPLLRRLGLALVYGLAAQFVLGFAALVGRNLDRADGSPHPLDVFLTTSHQAVGALILAAAVLTSVWTRRLVRSPDARATGGGA